MRRVFDLDVLACPRCGGRLGVIATVQDPRAVQAILAPRPAPSRSPCLSAARDAAPDARPRLCTLRRAQEALTPLRAPRPVGRTAGRPGTPIVPSAERQTSPGSDPTPAVMVPSRQGLRQGPGAPVGRVDRPQTDDSRRQGRAGSVSSSMRPPPVGRRSTSESRTGASSRSPTG
jgi:hypothetical protein